MISKLRLRVDSWVQIVLGLAGIVSWLLGGYGLAPVLVWLLWLWQTGSALELWLDYQHHSRKPYLWLAPILVLLAIFYAQGVFLLIGCAVVYGWHTIRDYRIVLRRPRSFWDL